MLSLSLSLSLSHTQTHTHALTHTTLSLFLRHAQCYPLSQSLSCSQPSSLFRSSFPPLPLSLNELHLSLSLSRSLHFLCQTFFSSLSLSSHLLFCPDCFLESDWSKRGTSLVIRSVQLSLVFISKSGFGSFQLRTKNAPLMFFQTNIFVKNRVKKNRPQWLLSFSSFLVHFAAADHEKKPLGFASRVEKYFSLSFFWITSDSFRFSVNLKL